MSVQSISIENSKKIWKLTKLIQILRGTSLNAKKTSSLRSRELDQDVNFVSQEYSTHRVLKILVDKIEEMMMD